MEERYAVSDSTIPWRSTSPEFDELWSGDTDSDHDPATDKVPDTLVTIFKQQLRYMYEAWPKEQSVEGGALTIHTTPREWGDITNRRVQGQLNLTFSYLVRELGEAMQHLDGSKSWKENPRPIDQDAFREEIADCLHFFVEFCILAGIDAESLFALYFRKSATNFNRVENQY
jgi:NTP pyrophosphatase (non-canonical NTP hydrolase)